jgi:hypothetical protein
MKPGGGSTKGSNWERRLAKSLSLWITDCESKDVLWRSQTSGARATLRAKSGGVKLDTQIGDIALADHESEVGRWFITHVVVEAKFLKKQNFWPGAEGTKTLFRFWDKLTSQAHEAKRTPLLIFKTNFQDALMFMPFPLWRRLVAQDSYYIAGAYVCSDHLPVGYVAFPELLGTPFALFRKLVNRE